MARTSRLKLRTVPATTANVTKGIVNYINACERCHADRINTTGIFDTVKKVFRKSNTRGVADIVACVQGFYVAIEFKNRATGDRIRKSQTAYSVRVRTARGLYIIVESYADFINKFRSVFPNVATPSVSSQSAK